MPRHVIILGAGLSGLTTAWYLKQRYPHDQITLLERESRVGGWIQTVNKKGYLFELGPHSCRSQGGEQTLALIQDLQLQSQVICPSKAAHTRYIFHQGTLHPLPNSLKKTPFSPLMKGWLKALWRDWKATPNLHADESIADFFSRRLGQDFVNRLINPFTIGIYAGDCQKLSLKSCFPRFHEWEKQGSLLKGAWKTKTSFSSDPWILSMQKESLFSFKKGMETLPLALAESLKGNLRLNVKIQSIQGTHVHLKTGEILKADKIVSTLPPRSLISLVNAYPAFQKCLNQLTYASVYVVSLGYKKSLPFQGFGYSIPSYNQQPLLGCIWDSSIFPQQQQKDHSCLTALVGGPHFSSIKHLSQKQIIALTIETLKKHMKLDLQPSVVHFKPSLFAIPQYEVGYTDWKLNLNQQLQQLDCPLILSGNAFNGISINDCIASAFKLSLDN